MQDLIEKVAAVAALQKEATPGPWVQWVEHASVYAGPAQDNTPGHLRGVRVQIAECFIDADYDLMSDFDEEQGPYDGHANAAFIAAVGSLDFAAIAAGLAAATPSSLVGDGEAAAELVSLANKLDELAAGASCNKIGTTAATDYLRLLVDSRAKLTDGIRTLAASPSLGEGAAPLTEWGDKAEGLLKHLEDACKEAEGSGFRMAEIYAFRLRDTITLLRSAMRALNTAPAAAPSEKGASHD